MKECVNESLTNPILTQVVNSNILLTISTKLNQLEKDCGSTMGENISLIDLEIADRELKFYLRIKLSKIQTNVCNLVSIHSPSSQHESDHGLSLGTSSYDPMGLFKDIDDNMNAEDDEPKEIDDPIL